MSEKRKDNKGRILKTGEGQRKDGTYMYRYNDLRGKRQCVYAPTLQELRDKEETIAKNLLMCQNPADGQEKIIDAVKRNIDSKTHIKYTTKSSYQTCLNWLEQEDFVQKRICDVRISHCKAFVRKLEQDGRGYNAIYMAYTMLKSTFRIAFEDDIIVKNPFCFSLKKEIKARNSTRDALTQEEQNALISFAESDERFSKHLCTINVLLHTGLRVSELCGLTKMDIDLKRMRIRVNKQLEIQHNGTPYITTPKTDCGERYIPLDTVALFSIKRVMHDRPVPEVEPEIDGYKGFLFLTKNGTVKSSYHIRNDCKVVVDAYNRSHEKQIKMTPHILRHTFCTNKIHAGMDIKSIQYLMGHSKADITLNTYGHATYEDAERAFFATLSG